MLARFNQGLASDMPLDYLNLASLNGGQPDRLDEANVFSNLQPPFAT